MRWLEPCWHLTDTPTPLTPHLQVSADTKAVAYTTWLGYYLTHSTTKRMQQSELVAIANRCAAGLACHCSLPQCALHAPLVTCTHAAMPATDTYVAPAHNLPATAMPVAPGPGTCTASHPLLPGSAPPGTLRCWAAPPRQPSPPRLWARCTSRACPASPWTTTSGGAAGRAWPLVPLRGCW
jgi:hypothetical protein